MLQDNTTNQPLISFILTCCDTDHSLLSECVGNILKMSLRDTEREIIIVDDGSATCLLQNIMTFADDIIYVRQPHRGDNAARNTGLQCATGRYIQFIDGGDTLLNEAYEHCIDLVRYYSPDIVMFNSSDRQDGKNDYIEEPPVDGAWYMAHNTLDRDPWGFLFSEKLLAGLRFQEGEEGGEQEFTTLLMIRAEKVYSTSAIAYHMRGRKDSGTADKKTIIRRLDDSETVLIRLRDMIDVLPVRERSAMKRRVAQLTMNHIINIIRLTRSAHQLETRLDRLEQEGLFPLPEKKYSKKYYLFSKLTRRTLTIKILKALLG